MEHVAGRIVRYLKVLARLAWRNPRKDALSWPPGALNAFARFRTLGQDHLLQQAFRHGPIFKQWMHGDHTTCVVGHRLGIQLLRQGQASMTGVTIDQTSLYPKGNVRAMHADDHKHYRRLLDSAVRSVPFTCLADASRDGILSGLLALSNRFPDSIVPADQLRRSLHEMATDVMILAMFGVHTGTASSQRLRSAYDRLGLRAPSSEIGAEQRDAFPELVSILRDVERELIKKPQTPTPSVLAHLAASGELDDTLRGNLIFIVETVRYDLAGLWRWILFYLGRDPDIARKARDDGDYLDAVVHETLRLNQSEYLLRLVSNDLAFQGFLIPKHSRVRVCLWEGHKDPQVFPDPFAFQPDRFIGRTYPIEQYSPFGLDKHRCVGAELTVEVTRLFIRTLVDHFVFSGTDSGVPTRGPHHWEPNPEFSMTLSPIG